MPADIVVPALGESVVEATVGRWLKHEGDPVAAGEPLVELETDKVNLEVSASQAGIVQQIARREGETVHIGDVLGQIGDGAGETRRPGDQETRGPGDQEARGQTPEAPGVAPGPQRVATPPAEPTPEPKKVTPVARHVAEDKGVDLSQVQPTGPGGWARKDDVLRAVEQPPAGQEVALRPPEQVGNGQQQAVPAEMRPAAPQPVEPARPPAIFPAPTSPRREERQRMSRRRQTIAQRLVAAQQTAAMLTTFNEIDLTGVMEVRKRRREAFKEQFGVGLGFMSFFTKATVAALKAFPRLNAEIQGDEIVLKHYYDIGIAVGAEEGLVVPVVRDADRLSFAEIERAIENLARRAREGTLTLEDLRGGTFSITNGGIFGSLLSTPILNPPQVGILGMHKIQERPVVQNGQIVIRPMMYVALTYDHRIVDGREAVQFLVRIKELLEDPERLLLEA